MAMKHAGFLTFVQPGDWSGPDPEGVIKPITPANVSSRRLWLGMKYVDNRQAITKCTGISRTNRRVFFTVPEIYQIIKGRKVQYINGLDMGECMFIGTSHGVFEARDAVRRRIGGEAICRMS